MQARTTLVLFVPIGVVGICLRAGATEYISLDSESSGGPPHAILDLSGSAPLDLDDAGEVSATLPFTLSWFGGEVSSARIAADGVLLFGSGGDPAAPECPADGVSWSGVAALWGDLGAGEVRAATFGRYPYRAWAVEWIAPDAISGGEGSAQAWLLEGGEGAETSAVIALEDLTWSDEGGDAGADGGARAVVGVAGDGEGLAWSCAGGLVEGSSAWFVPTDARPSAAERSSGSLRAWTGGGTFEYLGRTLATDDLEGDGWSDLVLGDQDEDAVYVVLGGPDDRSGAVSGADSVITGGTGDDLGAAIALGDLDGDGALELALGAPGSDTTGSSAGVVAVFAVGSLGALSSAEDDADLVLYGPSDGGKASAGSALWAGDLDGDGYAELAVGAPRADLSATDSGAVYLWPGGAAVLAGSASLADADATLEGVSSSDQAGRVLGGGDLDADGADELIVAAPYADASGGSNAGRVYVLPGGALGDGDLSSAATFTVEGSGGDDRLGLAVSAGDLDGDGQGELILGAPYVDDGASNGGAAYVFFGAAALSGALEASEADTIVLGDETSANLGATLGAGDLDADGRADLLVAAPNATGEAADAGKVGVFLSVAAGGLTLDSADHLLVGTDSAGAVGTALGVAADHDGDGFADLVAGGPYASPGGISRAGAVYLWSFVPDFLDEDDDGFVSVAAGGIDCDDEDEGVFPASLEVDGDGVDQDCDGWVDGVVLPRANARWWAWDLEEELGVTETALFDFEDATRGEDVDDLYLDDNLALRADGSVGAAALVWDSLPSGELGATVVAGVSGNGVTIYFGEPVEALSLRLLDGAAPFALSAWSGEEALFEDLPVVASGEGRTGGVFAGFSFAEEVDAVRVAGDAEDAWGFDDLAIVWAADTDGDEDGYTDNGGDCDDEDAARNPAEEEVLGNGVDDDCDGVIDGGGLELYLEPDTWEADAALSPTVIDFEDLLAGESIDDQYEELGVLFSGEVEASANVDGSAPRDTLGAECGEGLVRLEFDERQPALALWLLDASGGVTIYGEASGEPLYEVSVEPGGEDLAGGVFLGFVFDYGVDALEIEADGAFDVLGLDDVSLAPLGLDDADGDGFTEAEGDCDDHEPAATPEGEEVYYDGIDGDCDGASDYDADADGYDDASGGGPDCDDSSASVSPDAEEVYYDGVDADCDGLSDYDADGDGHEDESYGGDDCDDGDAEVSPDAEEVYYDGVDADCGGDSDYDADGDGFVPASYGGAIAGDESVSVGDCDDDEAVIFPGAEDAAYDGVDTDCGGDSDYDADDDGHDALAWGGDDCDDLAATTYPGSTLERCYDGDDSDCLGDSDWDCDQDGYELDSHGGEDCDDGDAAVHPGVEDAPRDGLDADCDGALEFDDDADGWDGAEDGGEDCDDDDPLVHPDAEDACYDGLDADCDGSSDDDCDKDGYDGDVAGGDDCEDEDASVHPGAVDWYYDGIDNDCDGEEDFDADGDGWPADWYGGTDCDDTDATIYPGAVERWYDGVDQDCAGDDDDDQDGDGSRAEAEGGSDCDDTDAAVGPSEDEIALDGTDQDCDGIDDVDEDEDGYYSAEDCDDAEPTVAPGFPETCYDGVDQDCDGADTVDCDGDGADASALGGDDCDDADPATYPGAPEIWYDGADEDCLGGDDLDQDGDGHRIDTLGGDDCDDLDAAISPSQAEDACGSGDEDCDGIEDEDCAEAGEQPILSDTGDPSEERWEEPGETGEGEGERDTASEPERQAPDPELVKQGCGCASGGGLGGALWSLLLVFPMFRRRPGSRARRSARPNVIELGHARVDRSG